VKTNKTLTDKTQLHTCKQKQPQKNNSYSGLGCVCQKLVFENCQSELHMLDAFLSSNQKYQALNVKHTPIYQH